MQGFTDPLKFDPDRFSPERQEDIKYGKNFLAFGHGPHYCVGKEYAINHLTAFLAILSMRCAPKKQVVYRLTLPAVIWETCTSLCLQRSDGAATTTPFQGGRDACKKQLLVCFDGESKWQTCFTCSCNWTRRVTNKSKDDAVNWQYLPTIYPADSLITLSKRADL